MRPLILWVLALSWLLSAGSIWASSDVTLTTKHLAPGVTLTQEIDKTIPLVINVVRVDLDAPGVHVSAGIGQDRISGHDATLGREDVSRLARRHGALVAVNADFFPFTGDPLGMGVKDGELYSEPYVGKGNIRRAALGLTADGHRVVFDVPAFQGELRASDGQYAIVNGINRPAAANEIIAYTALYGDTTGNKLGGTEVVLRDVNGPVRADKWISGKVEIIRQSIDRPEPIPADGVVLSAAPGPGADFLAQHVHIGDKVGFALGIATPSDTGLALKMALLPRTSHDLPSRSGASLSRSAYLWAGVTQAVGGGPRLLTHGQVTVDSTAEGFDAGFTNETHPRTAVGTTADGHHLLIVTVDGRQSIAKGVSLPDLALIMKRYGATDAINLDGGGSTVMAIAGIVVDSPSGAGEERPVADMLLVSSDHPYLQEAKLSIPSGSPPQDEDSGAMTSLTGEIEPSITAVAVGSATPLHLTVNGKAVSPTASGVLWQGPATASIGFVNQRGYFIAMKPGTGTVSALYKGQLISGTVTVTGPVSLAPTYAIHADFSADPGGAPNRSQLTVRVLDQSNKPMANAPVHLKVTGGTADSEDGTTNPDGYITIGVTWDANHGGSVLVTSGTLKPVTVSQH